MGELRPIIHVELSGMRLAITRALTDAVSGIDKAVGEAIDAAIESYPFGEQVKDITHAVLTESIKSAIRDAVWQVSHDPAFRVAIQRGLRDSFASIEVLGESNEVQA